MSQDRPVSKELAAKLAAYKPAVVPITDPARLLGPGVVGEPPHNESEVTPGVFEKTEEL